MAAAATPAAGGGAVPTPQDSAKSLADMKSTFDYAVEQSSKITEISTIGKVQEDAAKQRPQ